MRTSSSPMAPEGSSLQRLAGHTLVIPTYNRPALLRQLVTHLGRAAPRMAILVLDSSAAEIAAGNGRELPACAPNFRHVTVPTTTPMAAKIRDGLAHVATSTVSLCADDDLVFCDPLAQALRFIDEHPGHVSAHGLYLNFRPEGRAIHLTREYAGPGNEAGHAGARIYRLCQSYESLFYGAFRTADLRTIFNNVAAQPTLHFQELLQSVGALILGKVHRLPSIYAARRSGPEAEPGRDKWQTYYWFADNPAEFMEHYLVYRASVLAFYGQHGAAPRLSEADFLKAMDLAHIVYFAKGCPPAYFHDRLQGLWPGDPFERVDQVDLFSHLRGRVLPRPPTAIQDKFRRARRYVRAWRRQGSRDAVKDLDQAIAAELGTGWTCHLRVGLAWLAAKPEFTSSYRELCQYLNCEAEKEDHA